MLMVFMFVLCFYNTVHMLHIPNYAYIIAGYIKSYMIISQIMQSYVYHGKIYILLLGYEMLFYALEKASNEQARNTF